MRDIDKKGVKVRTIDKNKSESHQEWKMKQG